MKLCKKSSNPLGFFVWNAFVWKSFTGTVWVLGAPPKPKSNKLLAGVILDFCYILVFEDGAVDLENESKSKSPKALLLFYLEDYLWEAKL